MCEIVLSSKPSFTPHLLGVRSAKAPTRLHACAASSELSLIASAISTNGASERAAPTAYVFC